MSIKLQKKAASSALQLSEEAYSNFCIAKDYLILEAEKSGGEVPEEFYDKMNKALSCLQEIRNWLEAMSED